MNTSPNCMCVFSSNRAGELKVLTHNENVYCLNNSEEKSRLYTHSLVTGVINGELYQGEYNEPVDFHVDQSCSNYHVGAMQLANDTCRDTRHRWKSLIKRKKYYDNKAGQSFYKRRMGCSTAG